MTKHAGDTHKIDVDRNIQWHLDALDPYEEALKGGKHAGIITKSKKMSNKEINNTRKYLRNYHNIDDIIKEAIANNHIYFK